MKLQKNQKIKEFKNSKFCKNKTEQKTHSLKLTIIRELIYQQQQWKPRESGIISYNDYKNTASPKFYT